MHKLLLIALLVGLFGFRGAAQGLENDPQGLKQRLRSQYLHNDTAQAIINLYGRRQAGGAGWMVAGALSAVRIATASNTTSSNYGGYAVQNEGPNVGAVFLVASPILGYGLSKMLRFGNGRLERTLTAYAAGQPLPRSLRRKLKPRFFNQPIINYKAVPVKAAS